MFSVKNNVVETFRVVIDGAGGLTVSDTSGVVNILPAVPHHFVKGAGVSDPMTVNTVRSLSLTLYDEFNNTISDSVVTFTRVTGNGTFTASGTATTDVTSNASGVVSADYQASTLTSYGSDVIEITIGDVVSTITIPLQAAAIDTFVFAPSGGRDLVAGKWLQYIVTAKDAQGNNVTSNQSVTLSATSANASFSRSTSLAFNNSDTLMFSVKNNVVETFRVVIDGAGGLTVSDTSGVVNILPAVPHHFVKGAGVSDPMTVNTVRSLSLTLYDEFNNTISDSVVTFTRVTGNGTFTASGTATTDVTSNASGVVSADYQASTLTSYGSDVIEVTIGDVVSTITIPLQAAAIDTFVFAPSGGRDLVAGKWLQYIVTAKDAQGNNVTSNQSVTLSATSANASFSRSTSLAFNNSDTLMFSVKNNVVETFRVVIDGAGGLTVSDTSGVVNILPAVPHHFVKGAGVSDPITVNTVRSLSLTLYDEFNNTISDSVVIFTRVTGNGTFTASGTATTDVTSNASGVVSADYQASTLTSYGSDVIEITIGDVVSTITIPLQAAAIDTFVFAPSGGRDLVAGKWLQYIVTAKDAQGNNVTSNQSVTLSATSANASFSRSTSLAFNNSDTLMFSVKNNVVETFRVVIDGAGGLTVSDTSGVVNILPAVPHHFVKGAGVSDPMTVNTVRSLSLTLYDEFNNTISDSVVTFTR